MGEGGREGDETTTIQTQTRSDTRKEEKESGSKKKKGGGGAEALSAAAAAAAEGWRETKSEGDRVAAEEEGGMKDGGRQTEGRDTEGSSSGSRERRGDTAQGEQRRAVPDDRPRR